MLSLHEPKEQIIEINIINSIVNYHKLISGYSKFGWAGYIKIHLKIIYTFLYILRDIDCKLSSIRQLNSISKFQETYCTRHSIVALLTM